MAAGGGDKKSGPALIPDPIEDQGVKGKELVPDLKGQARDVASER